MRAYCTLAVLVMSSMIAVYPAENATGEVSQDHARDRTFIVYDNMFYRGKPDTAKEGLVASNILYESLIWPDHKRVGVLPKREDFVKLVRSSVANPGPLVIDVEDLPLSGDPQTAHAHMEVLAMLAVWAHQAAPKKVFGYYGTHTLTGVKGPFLKEARELARHVDAFFPPMYTFDDDQEKWGQRAQQELDEAHQLGPGKPVYFYLWPQYHDRTPKEFQFVSADYWKFQLETAHRLVNGVVLWGPSKFDWDNQTGWWSETQAFMKAIGRIQSTN